jgi:hypothetical protein
VGNFSVGVVVFKETFLSAIPVGGALEQTSARG